MFGAAMAWAQKSICECLQASPTRLVPRGACRGSIKMAEKRISPIRVLVVDDHPLVRERIAAILEAQPDMSLAPRFKSFEHIVRMWF
jgi:PleD family two-component response regulator